MESFYTMARKRDIKLTLVTPTPDSPLPMAFDTEKIERVFFNLLSNAFKHTPDNGSITVTYAEEGGNLILHVADTGEGISERDLDKIFDRFYQVDRIHPNGSGIGLAVTKAFVELHGGTISVESALQKGTVFTVTMPVKHIAETLRDADKHIDSNDVAAELDAISGHTDFRNDKPIVLIVDDNKDIQQLVGELLRADYNILTASNGKEGVKMAVRHVPDLIICDVMMPVMDGLECCRHIKSEISTSHIPVLMLTACSLDEQRVQGYDSGADGYLAKPFNSAVLKSKCSSLIANRRRIKNLYESTGLPGTVARDTQTAARKNSTGADIDNEFYARFLDIFKAEMGNSDLSVDAIASRMGLERSQFYRKIKALTNYAPVELMRRLRLQQGRTLLTTTTGP